MLSSEQIRIIEPVSTQNLSDEEVEALYCDLQEFAQLAFEAYWLDSNSGSKNHVGLLSLPQSTDTI
jgi:hypothetical protein